MNVQTKQVMLELKRNPAEEPALKVGGAITSVAGLLSIILYFFPDIPDNVVQGILVGSAFLLPIITAVLTRGKVWSPQSVLEVLDQAVDEGKKSSVTPPTLHEVWGAPKEAVKPADKPPFNE